MFVRSQVAFHGFPISVALKKIGAIGKQEQLSDRLAEADAFVPPDPATCLGHAHLGVDYFLQTRFECSLNPTWYGILLVGRPVTLWL